MFTDKILTCRDCGQEFVFSASEQEFFAEKGFTNEPGRCPICTNFKLKRVANAVRSCVFRRKNVRR